MRFYDALQMDPSVLKQKIRASEDTGERRKLMAAIAVRSALIVLFAIMVISPAGKVFGQENSPMAVAMFCILLGIRFVDFGYCVRDSLINFAIVFVLLLVAPSAAAHMNPFLAALVHSAAFFVILFMTSDRPEMGNAGLYTFAYIYLSGNPVSGVLLGKRALLTLVGYVLCAAILFVKHRKKNQDVRFRDVVARFSFSNKVTQWHLQLALGVGILLALGSYFNLPRMMWAAFACGSILGCYSATPVEAKERVGQRMIGACAGSLIFFLGVQILPESLLPFLGPFGGLCMGFCTDYRYKTACNCLGAIMMAASVYGAHGAAALRVVDNLLGVAFGFVFLVAYQKVASLCCGSEELDGIEDPSV